MKKFKVSPLTRKRFGSFMRIRRAWYSLIALGIVFVVCLFADVICPYSPTKVIPPDTLKSFLKPTVERTLDVRSARFTVLKDGEVIDFEGPGDIAKKLNGVFDLSKFESEHSGEYCVSKRDRGDYMRVSLVSRKPEVVHETVKEPKPVAYPFRPCKSHVFGIDSNGFDVFSRVVHGLRLSLVFGFVLAFSGLLLGLLFGAIEGYFGGLTDLVGQRITEIWSAMPFLYVMIFIGSSMGSGLTDAQRFLLLLFCYAIFNWIAVSYYVRAEFLRLRGQTFVESAKCQGFSSVRIIFCHILPNALTPLITLFPFLLMGAIGSLAALDFLGFGLPPMAPSCGELLHQAQTNPSAWWLILFPSLALFIVMLLTVFIGEGLRDAFDPRQKSKLE